MLLANHVWPVFFVFETSRIKQFRIHCKVMFHLDCKWRGTSLWIVDCNLDFHLPKTQPSKPLCHFGGIRHGGPVAVEPQPVAKTDGVDNQRVAFPFPGRIPEPVGRWIV